MARRLSVKNKKRARDIARAYASGQWPPLHKVAVERSKRAKKKKANPA